MAINHRMRKELNLNIAGKTRPQCEKRELNPNLASSEISPVSKADFLPACE